tara:strand:+ start:2526 stop:2780 length:255 start_codon:yes stop_codon:yes gene_type:complete
MKLSIYYVIAKELQNSNYAGEEDFVEETTGHKTVTVYTVEDGKIDKFFELNLLNTENTEEEIGDYLFEHVNDCVLEDGFNLIQL